MSDAKSDATTALDAHGRSIDELHRKLAALPGCDKERLAGAVNKYKAAHQTFHDDALACVDHFAVWIDERSKFGAWPHSYDSIVFDEHGAVGNDGEVTQFPADTRARRALQCN